MSQPRHLIIQAEPLIAEFLTLVGLARRCDPACGLGLERLGLFSPASFTARGGVLFVGYRDAEPVVIGALSPSREGRADLAAASFTPSSSNRDAILDHMEDAAHLMGFHRVVRVGEAGTISGLTRRDWAVTSHAPSSREISVGARI